MFRLIQVAREQMNATDSLRQRVEQVEGQMKDFHAELHTLCEASGRSEPEADDAAADVQQLQSDLEKAKESHRKVSALRKQLQEGEAEFAELERRLAKTREELDVLLSAANASDPEDFRQRARLFGSRQLLKAEVEKHQGALKAISGPGQAYDKLRSFLASRDAGSLEAEIAQLRESLAEEERQEQGLAPTL